MGTLIDLTGKKFGRLTVIKRARNNSFRDVLWLCSCSCGNETIVRGVELRKGDTRSCGCLHKDVVTIHGFYKHPLYDCWKGLMRRCYKETDRCYKDYGKRGISVCDEWHDISTFIIDVESLLGSRPKGYTIDRINNDGNYEHNNVRWATMSEQNINRRVPKNNTSTHRGIHFNRSTKKWQANIKHKGKRFYLGEFKDFTEAVKARKKAEEELWR